MFRICLNSLPEKCFPIASELSQNLQIVRWRRKPRWLPVAKSKLFRIPERKQAPLGERLELLRLYNHYRTQIRSVRLFLREDLQRKEETSTADHLVVTPEEEEAEFQKCMLENEAWNAKIAIEREKRLQKQVEERTEQIKQRLEVAKLKEEENLRKVEEIVRKEKEAAKSYITREKLDSAIEYALANPVDYNFSIDLKGNIYHGRLACNEKKLEEKEAKKESLSM